MFSVISYFTVAFLNNLCDSEDLATQLQCLRNLDKSTRGIFGGTVFSNEIFLAYAHIHSDLYELSRTRLACIKTAAAVLFNYYSL